MEQDSLGAHFVSTSDFPYNSSADNRIMCKKHIRIMLIGWTLHTSNCSHDCSDNRLICANFLRIFEFRQKISSGTPRTVKSFTLSILDVTLMLFLSGVNCSNRIKVKVKPTDPKKPFVTYVDKVNNQNLSRD